jgi:hypothetical protein
MGMESHGGMIEHLDATLSNTNPTLTDPGANPSLRCERPATNLLSHGTVKILWLMLFTLITVNKIILNADIIFVEGIGIYSYH